MPKSWAYKQCLIQKAKNGGPKRSSVKELAHHSCGKEKNQVKVISNQKQLSCKNG